MKLPLGKIDKGKAEQYHCKSKYQNSTLAHVLITSLNDGASYCGVGILLLHGRHRIPVRETPLAELSLYIYGATNSSSKWKDSAFGPSSCPRILTSRN
jgi:hypothetical protein